jgi:hypothetical protein
LEGERDVVRSLLLLLVPLIGGCAHSHVGQRGGPAGIFHGVGQAWTRYARSFEEQEAETEGNPSSFNDRSQYPPVVPAHGPIEVSGRTDTSVPSVSTSSSTPNFSPTAAKQALSAIDLDSCARRASLPVGYLRVGIRFLGVTGGIGSIDIVEPTNVGDTGRYCVENLLKDVKVGQFNRDDIVVNHTWFIH